MMERFDSALLFEPVYMERVWGGSYLRQLPGRHLPDTGAPIGESWELSDRPEAVSVVASGPAKGMTLSELWSGYRVQVFGEPSLSWGRCWFPLLIKVLDCGDDLSIQVHPPLEAARALGGECKTEMWYVYDADPGARLIAGLKDGVSRSRFEEAVKLGSVAECVHQLHPRSGDSLFVHSGRIHALGKGMLVFEVQQNSDTTYRVYDWDRVGLDGKPRELHVQECLQCIDFADHSPSLQPSETGQVLADCDHFRVTRFESGKPRRQENKPRGRIIMAIKPTQWGDEVVMPGRVAIWPACVPAPEPVGEWLEIELPEKH